MSNFLLRMLVLPIPKALWEIPTLPMLQVGTFSISTYPLMICVGALGMLAYTISKRNRFGLSKIACAVFALLLTFCGIAGAKILYVLENLPESIKNGFFSGGVSFFGSVYLVPLLMPLIGRILGLKAGQTNDLCGPCVAIMIGFIRIGCLLSGCCGGRVAYIGNYYFAWPTQIIESIGDFLIFFFLLRIQQKKMQELLYPLFMICYSVLRFLVEFLRYEPKGFLNLSNGHWFAMIAFFAALVWIAVHKIKNAANNGAKKR